MDHSVPLLQEAIRTCTEHRRTPDVILLQEVGALDLWVAKGWTAYRTPPHHHEHWCPAAILVRPKLRSWQTGSQMEDTVVVTVQHCNVNTVFVSTYLSPSLRIGLFNDKLSELKRATCTAAATTDRVVVGGDLNAKHGMWMSHGERHLARGEAVLGFWHEASLELATPQDLGTFQRGTTRVSTIDLTFHSRSVAVHRLAALRMTSDGHRPIVFTLLQPAAGRNDDTHLERLQWYRLNSDALRRRLELTFTESMVSTDANECWNTILSRLDCALRMDGERPSRGNRRFRQQHWWWNDECTAARDEYRNARRQTRGQIRHELDENVDGSRRERRQAIERFARADDSVQVAYRKFRSTLRRTEAVAISSALGDLTTAQEWEALRAITGRDTARNRTYHVEELQTDHGLATSWEEQERALVKQFFPQTQPSATQMGQAETDHTASTESELPLITQLEAEDAINTLNSDGAAGNDAISPALLKFCWGVTPFRAAMMELFNICLRTQVFPNAWKEARPHRIQVFTDSQAALKRITATWTADSRSGQRLCAAIRATDAVLRRDGIDITFHWVPGHMGIAGNEQADEQARRGATRPAVAAATAMALDCAAGRIRRHYEKEWSAKAALAANRSSSYREINPTFDLQHFDRYKRRSTPTASALLKWRAGTLMRIYRSGAANTCKCGARDPTRSHFLLSCRLTERETAAVLERLPPSERTIQRILRGDDGQLGIAVDRLTMQAKRSVATITPEAMHQILQEETGDSGDEVEEGQNDDSSDTTRQGPAQLEGTDTPDPLQRRATDEMGSTASRHPNQTMTTSAAATATFYALRDNSNLLCLTRQRRRRRRRAPWHFTTPGRRQGRHDRIPNANAVDRP